MRRLIALVTLAAALLVPVLGAQAPGTSGRPTAAAATATPRGLIVGRVVDAGSAAPIANVVVSLSGAPLPALIRVFTDAKGQFLLRNVPKGTFTLRATIGSNLMENSFRWSGAPTQIGPYLAGGYGQRRPGGLVQALDLADGEQIADVVIKLWKGGSIDGTVVDEAGEPLVDVYVAAARRSADGQLLNGPSVRTDDRGSYHFGSLVPGNYVIVVPQEQVAVPAETSDTLASTTNRVLSAKLANTGARSFTGGIAVGSSLAGTSSAYNGNALSPVPQGDVLHVYQTTFAPSTTSLSAAATVTVGPGETRSGADVALRPVRAVAVSGTIADELGPVANFGVRLFTREGVPGAVALDVAYTSTDARGRFTFPLVPPGTYRMVAQRYATTRFGPDVVLPPPGPPRAAEKFGAWAEQDIVVGDRDVTDLALQLKLGVSVSGRVEFRGSGRRPSADAMRQSLVFVSPFDTLSRSFPTRPFSDGIDAANAFDIRDVTPGRYALVVNPSAGVSLLNVLVNGRSMTERPVTIGPEGLSDIVIEVTDRPAEVAGTVRTRGGVPDGNAGVVLFPADRTRWTEIRQGSQLARSARVSKSGAFNLRPVVPGDYFIAALDDEATADFPDPKFLEALAASASPLRVTAGVTQTVVLTTIDAPAIRGSQLAAEHAPLAAAAAHGPFVADDADPQARDTQVQAPAPPKTTAVLTGVVTTDDQAPRALRHAVVTAAAPEIPGPRQAVTDTDGRFTFTDLPPGRYSLVVEKPGYVKTFHGSKRPGGTPGTPVAVLAGQPGPSVAIRVPRGGVIAGTVRDQFGTAVGGAEVSVKQAVVTNGRRGIADVANLRVPKVTTDDLGRYRIYGLPPGEYIVHCAIPTVSTSGVRETNSADVEAVLRELRAGRSVPATPPAAAAPRQVSLAGGYLPGVPDAESAQTIALAIGEERTGADILIGPLRALSVSGTSVGPGGTPMRNIMVAVVNTATGTRIGSGGVAMPGTDGRFVLSALPPGRYTLMGRAAENNAEPEPADMPYFAEAEFVLIDQNISGVVLQFERGATVTGRIVPPAGAAAGSVASVRLGATPVDSFMSLVPTRVTATTAANGTFRFDGLGPGKWRVTGASLPTGWRLRSAVHGGRDTLDIPLEVRLGEPISDITITMTDQPTEITGVVSDAAGRPTSDYAMFAFSTERALWTTAPRRLSGLARLSSDGRYRITGLPPGEYYLVALNDVDSAQLSDPAFLESLIPGTTKVVLGEGERKVSNYQVR